jgi:FAD:protein FMN transferase
VIRDLTQRLCIAVICLLLAACGREPLYHAQGYVFGTLVEVSIYGQQEEVAQAASNQILQEFQRLHQKLHAWDEHSDLSQLNQAFADGQTIPIDAELASMLQQVTTLSTQSNGLFNPAIGNLIQQWGFQRDGFTPVKIDDTAIAKLVTARPQMTDIVITQTPDGDQFMASSHNKAVKLDLGGYAKGYALDRAASLLREQGISDALINIGGNILALGQRGKQPWRVGIQHPRKPTAIATIDLPDGWAVGTSGDYQRFFELDGQRYSHLIQSESGYPVQHTQAVTVLIPPGELTGTLSDVLSKPIFIAEPAFRPNIAANIGLKHYLVIDSQGHAFATEPMAAMLQWQQEQYGKLDIIH